MFLYIRDGLDNILAGYPVAGYRICWILNLTSSGPEPDIWREISSSLHIRIARVYILLNYFIYIRPGDARYIHFGYSVYSYFIYNSCKTTDSPRHIRIVYCYLFYHGLLDIIGFFSSGNGGASWNIWYGKDNSNFFVCFIKRKQKNTILGKQKTWNQAPKFCFTSPPPGPNLFCIPPLLYWSNINIMNIEHNPDCLFAFQAVYY